MMKMAIKWQWLLKKHWAKIVGFLITALSYALALRLDLFDRVYHFTTSFEPVELGEVIPALLVLLIFMVWYMSDRRKRAEKLRKEQEEGYIAQLKTSKNQYETLLRNMNDGFVVADRDEAITFANRRLSEMLGYVGGELIGKDVNSLLDRENQNKLRSETEKRRFGQSSAYELEFITKDGGRFPAIVSAAPLYDERGEHIGSFAVVTDIVEMKSLQRQLKEQAEDLRGKNKIMDDELATARKVQQSLLPHKYPTDSGLEFYVRYLPTLAIGGDFYDIIEIAPGLTGVLISDVGGHGVQAALITMIIKTMVEAMARQSKDPSTMLSRINEGLVDMFPDESPFITAFYIVIDAVNGKVVYANAGHPYPLLLRKGCSELKELSADGLFWGGYAEAEYQNQELDLKDEDTMLLYTDGLYRLVNEREEELGRDTLYAIINRSLGLGPKELVEKILANIDEFTGRSLELDDICILAVKVNLSQEATFFEPS